MNAIRRWVRRWLQFDDGIQLVRSDAGHVIERLQDRMQRQDQLILNLQRQVSMHEQNLAQIQKVIAIKPQSQRGAA